MAAGSTPLSSSGAKVGRWLGAFLVTALAGGLVHALTLVALPFVDIAAIRERLGAADVQLTGLSIGALGITPWLSAALLVECVALVVPRWRHLRHGGPTGRRPLERASTSLGVAFSVAQATMLAAWLANLSDGVGLLAPELQATVPRVVAIATLTAGACVTRLLAGLVARVGAGNGVSVVVAVGALVALVGDGVATAHAVSDGTLAPAGLALALVVLAATALAVWHLVVVDSGDTRELVRPTAGLNPAEIGLSLAMLPATVATLLEWDPTAPLRAAPLVAIVVTVGVTALLTTWWSSPAKVSALWAALDGSAPGEHLAAARDAVRRALRATLALNLVIVAGQVLLRDHVTPWHGVSVAVVVAVAHDLLDEARARRLAPDLQAIWPVHRLDHVGPMLDALRARGIVAFARGVHHRALFHFFLPAVAVDILVPVADVARATETLGELAGPLTGTDRAPARDG
jgi:hypothetical protein